jgi:F0F1-type ATP synthase alpha subunit
MREELFLPLERHAPSIMARSPISQPLLSGFCVIDTLVPLGRGQRQLVIGNRNTGKTTLIFHIINNQKQPNRYFSPEGRGRDRIFCIYNPIRARLQDLKVFFSSLKKTQTH